MAELSLDLQRGWRPGVIGKRGCFFDEGAEAPGTNQPDQFPWTRLPLWCILSLGR
jgi:hypothetical protein